MKPFSNQFGAWFVADFPMEYDPCTCLKQSTVTLKVKLISQAQVSLSGTSTGTLASINNGAGTGPKDPSFRSVLAGTASGATTLINSTSSAFNSPYSLANNLLGGGTKASVTSFAEALAKSNFLKDGLKALPYVGTVASLLSFFLGGGQDSGPQKVSVQPMAINLSTITSGTITYSSDYSGSRFSTPGSQIRTGYLEEYPNYNEILGVATLIRKPKFDVVEAGLDQLFPDQLPEEFGDYPYYGGSGGQAILCFA